MPKWLFWRSISRFVEWWRSWFTWASDQDILWARRRKKGNAWVDYILISKECAYVKHFSSCKIPWRGAFLGDNLVPRALSYSPSLEDEYNRSLETRLCWWKLQGFSVTGRGRKSQISGFLGTNSRKKSADFAGISGAVKYCRFCGQFQGKFR